CRTPCARLSRSATGFGCWTDERSCGSTFSRRLAAASRGLRPLATAVASVTSAWSAGVARGSAGAGRPGATRPAGIGMITVRSAPRSANGSSGTAHRPELELEAGELARDVHRERPRLLGHLPEIPAALQLEVEEARVIGDLPRRYRQAAQHDARQVQVHEVADALDRPDLHQGGQARREPRGPHRRPGARRAAPG